MHKEDLRGWVRQAEADRGERDDRLTTVEQDELRQLRKEAAELSGPRQPHAQTARIPWARRRPSRPSYLKHHAQFSRRFQVSSESSKV
ncbi:hypothetical protein ACFYR1_45090 [Streptomyces canus]|uniref:hypothetical protein n=1 Tax=Streptomyces canus TaxID=58343 RepID=UPI00367F14ED